MLNDSSVGLIRANVPLKWNGLEDVCAVYLTEPGAGAPSASQ